MSNQNILEVRNLKATFSGHGQKVQAVRGVSFTLEQGQIMGLVGESGSGKSVTMKAVMGMLPGNATVTSDELLFRGKDLKKFSEAEYRAIRGKDMTMIFQDPMTALNPLKKIGKHLEEIIVRHQKCSKSEAKKRAVESLRKVGISNPEVRLGQYPHEFSGGMRQRVLIAMALACEPELLIADEPTTALDVTIQAQILDLLGELEDKYHTSIILITHDMGVVASLCSKIAIMYGGLIMESGTTDEIFYDPKHPYTKALLKAVPRMDLEEGERLKAIPGVPPSLVEPPKGCPFAERCEFAKEICREKMPQYRSYSETHQAMCHLDNFEESDGGRDE